MRATSRKPEKKATTQRSSQVAVSLAEELSVVDAFIGVARARHADSLSVTREVDEAALSASVPPLSLQPLVENAVQHGVARAEGGGTVSIRIRRDATHLDIEVRDILRGVVESNGDSTGSGIGLRTTRERLARLYGDGYRLEMQPVVGGGTVVTLRLPIERFAKGN